MDRLYERILFRKSIEDFLVVYIGIIRGEMRMMSSSDAPWEMERRQRLHSSLYEHLTCHLRVFLGAATPETLQECFVVLDRFGKRIKTIANLKPYL